MPFCTACGTNVEKTALVCGKCGAAITTSSPSIPVAAAQPPKKGTSGLKIVLMVFPVIIIIGVLAVAAIVGATMYIARHSSVEEGKNSATIKTPLGNIEAGNDPQKVAADMGVALYPGATVSPQSGGVSIGGFSAGSLIMTTSDSADQVMAFYKEQFPKAAVTVQQDEKHVMTVNTAKGMVVITTEPVDSKTKITLANVSGVK